MHNHLLYIGVLMVSPMILMLLLASMVPPNMRYMRPEPGHNEILAGIALMTMTVLGSILIGLSFIQH